MFNLIRADLYRLTHKKSNFIFFLILAIGYCLISLFVYIDKVRNGDVSNIADSYSPESMLLFGQTCIRLGFAILIPQMFISVYMDDITSRRFIGTLGSGKTISEYVVGKLLTSIVYTIIGVAFLGSIFVAHFAIMSKGFMGDISKYDHSINKLSMMLLCAVVSMIIYGMMGFLLVSLNKKTVVSLVVLVVCVLELPSQILGIVSMALPGLSVVNKNIWDAWAFRPIDAGQMDIKYWIAAACYFAVFFIGSIIIMNKKDLSV